jgi:ABC-type branched-subunit amino acid transport system substrate-binding protein
MFAFVFKVPQISYASSSPELSNRERFPYFARVVPSDALQAEGMAKIVKLFGWTYVATISEEGNSGSIKAFAEFIKQDKSNQIASCWFFETRKNIT